MEDAVAAQRLAIAVKIDEEDANWYTFSTSPFKVVTQQVDQLEQELEHDVPGVVFAGVDEDQSIEVLFSEEFDNLAEAWIDTLFTIGKTLGFELNTIDVLMVTDPRQQAHCLRAICDEHYQFTVPVYLPVR